LRPEQSLNIELGLRGKTTSLEMNWDYDMAVFQLERDDYIMSTAGQYSLPVNGTLEQYQNIGGMRSRGFELSLNSDRARQVSMNVAYTYLRSEFTKYDNFNLLLGNRYGTYVADCSTLNPATQYCLQPMDLAGKIVPRTPMHHLNTSLDYRPAHGWTITGEMDAYSSYYADEPNMIKIDQRTIFNTILRYDTKFSGENKATFFLRIDNLLEEDYYHTARGSSDGNRDGKFDAEDISLVVNPGRVWTSGVSVQF
jgi:iron complex outermembrane receptor protein